VFSNVALIGMTGALHRGPIAPFSSSEHNSICVYAAHPGPTIPSLRMEAEIMFNAEGSCSIYTAVQNTPLRSINRLRSDRSSIYVRCNISTQEWQLK